METVNNRVRVLFQIHGQNKSFYWFECRDEDIYWGYSGKASKFHTTAFSGKTADINLNNCIEDTFKSAKLSYHKSGQFHIKLVDDDGNSKYTTVMDWRKKDKISEPFRIMALFTMAPINYEDYNKSPTRKGAKAIIIRIDGESKDTRRYVEFYICKEGEFSAPKPLIATTEPVADKPVTFSLSNNYILAIRILSFPSAHALNNWHPDKEICFYTQNETDS